MNLRPNHFAHIMQMSVVTDAHDRWNSHINLYANIVFSLVCSSLPFLFYSYLYYLKINHQNTTNKMYWVSMISDFAVTHNQWFQIIVYWNTFSMVIKFIISIHLLTMRVCCTHYFVISEVFQLLRDMSKPIPNIGLIETCGNIWAEEWKTVSSVLIFYSSDSIIFLWHADSFKNIFWSREPAKNENFMYFNKIRCNWLCIRSGRR